MSRRKPVNKRRREKCESRAPGCGPVVYHDSQGVPLCAQCRDALFVDEGVCLGCYRVHRDPLVYDPVANPGIHLAPWACLRAERIGRAGR